MTDEITSLDAETFQAFTEAVTDAIESLAEAVHCFAEIIAEEFLPTMRVVIEFLRRYGLFTQLYHRFGHCTRLAWWVAWRLPSWLVWKLPLNWVRWSV